MNNMAALKISRAISDKTLKMLNGNPDQHRRVQILVVGGDRLRQEVCAVIDTDHATMCCVRSRDEALDEICNAIPDVVLYEQGINLDSLLSEYAIESAVQSMAIPDSPSPGFFSSIRSFVPIVVPA